MALIPFTRPTAAQALALADELRRRLDAAGRPPAVEALAPRPRRAFDRMVDALNRLPRPVAVIGTLALLAAAVAAPDWFASRMEALSRMPEALWWLIGAVLSLHFGARLQAHAQEHERDLVATVAAVAAPPEVPLRAASPAAASPGGDAEVTLATLAPMPNPAVEDWRRAAA